MQIQEALSADVMVAAFLQAEVDSPRFGEQVLGILARDHQGRHILDAPDLNNADENAYRARLLGEWRGYGRDTEVFTDLPADTRWYRARLDGDDLKRVKYINDNYWTDFSGGSRLIWDAVLRIRSGEMDSSEAACYRMLADALAQGARFPDMILLHNPCTDELVVLEGHIRMTAYLLSVVSATAWPGGLSVILGSSATMQK